MLVLIQVLINYLMTYLMLMCKKMWAYVLTPFYYLEYGTFLQQLQSSIVLAIPASPILYLLHLAKTYFFSDADFVEVLFILITADLVTGVFKHLKLKDFSWKQLWIGLLEKVFVSCVGMVLFNAMGAIKGLEQNAAILTYFRLVGKLINAFYVGGSAFNNLFILTGGKFPPVGWMQRMKNFNLSGKLGDLTEEAETSANKDKN